MINGVSTVSPLIGLLGTVVGMIMSFNQIAGAEAMGRTTELATGIAMALLTTAIGLAIAIPALILYLYLASRVDSLVMEMDLLAQDVVNLISYEALSKEGGPARSKSRGRAAKKKAV
jgi:biopolymer transport protein ExbB